MDFFSSIWNLLTSIISLFTDTIGLIIDSFVNGIQFFVSTITSIPNLVFDILDELPVFFQIGLTGVFGLLLFVIFFKLLQLIKII